MKVVMPVCEGKLSPVLDAAKRLLVVKVEDGMEADRCQVSIEEESLPRRAERMAELGEHCSMTERRADDATRDAVAWLKCEFMLDKVGEEFSGIISTVTGFGLFVILDDNHVEGLIHITALKDDYYHFDQLNHKMKGERTGKTFQIGDKISIKVAAVSLDERKIDFVPLNAGRKKPQKGGFRAEKQAAPEFKTRKEQTEEKVEKSKKRKNRRRRWMK